MAGRSDARLPGFLGTLKWLIYLFFLTLVIDLAVAFLAGTTHLQRVLREDLARIERLDFEARTDQYDRSIRTANTLYRWVFVGSGIDAVGRRYFDPTRFDPERTHASKYEKARQVDDHILARFYVMSWPMIESAMLGLQIYGVRLGLVLSLMPAAILLFMLAAIDGWVIRHVRRYRAARESSDRHNIAIAGLYVSLLVIGVYLALPLSLDPRLVLLPGLLLNAFFVWLAVAYFKKYW